MSEGHNTHRPFFVGRARLNRLTAILTAYKTVIVSLQFQRQEQIRET
jgi:hypothetical protein